MNGQGHALSASLAWFVAAPAVAERLGDPVGRWELAAGGLVAAGCGLLPDIDHPGATAARTFGPVGRAAAKIVARAAGGHRGHTHRILFALAAGGGVAFAAARWSWAAAVVVGVVGAWAWRAIGPQIDLELVRCDLDAVAFGLVAGGVTVARLEPGWWLPAAVAGGALVHLAGDRVFGGRSPLRVGGHVEQVVVWLLSMALPVVVLVQLGVLVPGTP